MKKLLVLLAALLLAAIVVPAAFAEVELGMGWTPASNPDAAADDPSKNDSITGFHFGYSWFILYGTWDGLALPAWIVENQTTYTDITGFHPGFALPAFLNLYDVGVRVIIRPVVVYAEVGVNNLAVYGGETFKGIGANLRLGAGVRFGFWGLNLSGTSMFSTFDELTSTLKALGSDETSSAAWGVISQGLLPSLNLTFYF